MAIRYYILPIDVVETSPGEYARGPKYLKWRFNPTGMECQWGMKDYGSINVGSVAVDTTVANHTTLGGYSDVYQFPENIDATMTSQQRNALSSFLEGVGVPGDWISPQDTFRTALRTVTAMFLFMQRLTGMTGNVSPLDWGYTLNTQWRNMSVAHQNAITDAAASLGYSTAFIGSTTQIRAMLKNFSDQWGDAPILFGLTTL